MSKTTLLDQLICYHIKLYNIMGIKNYKGRIKYVIAMNSIKYLETTQSSPIIDYKKLYNQIFNKIKYSKKSKKMIDDLIKECKNNMK